jgi:hypothetical protein
MNFAGRLDAQDAVCTASAEKQEESFNVDDSQWFTINLPLKGLPLGVKSHK